MLNNEMKINEIWNDLALLKHVVKKKFEWLKLGKLDQIMDKISLPVEQKLEYLYDRQGELEVNYRTFEN